MVVCKFWQQGHCRFGDSCRFEHPGRRDVVPNGNRFAALQSPDNSQQRNNRSQQRNGPPSAEFPYSLDKQAIVTDLSSERPQWILSAYGPGRHAPAQLFGGPLREQSPEEIRLQHYMGLAGGNAQQAVQEYESILQASEQQMRTALSDVDGAIKFIIRAENEHPNRIDICHESRGKPGGFQNPLTTTNQPAPTPNSFEAQSQSSVNPFSAASQPPTRPGFGQPSALGNPTGGGAFGQASALGQRPSPFGAPSAPSAFGAPSRPGNADGAFGQPSVLGQKPNPFGVPAQTASGGFSSFANQGSAFVNSPAAPLNTFGASSQPAFGAPSQPGNAPNPFGTPSQPAFGGPSQIGVKPNPFGAPSQPPAAQGSFGAPQQPSSTPNPFGASSQSSTTQNSFGAPSQPSVTPNPFGATSQATPFGAPSQPQANFFGQPSDQKPNSFGQPSVQSVNPFGAPSSTSQANPLSPAKQTQFGAPSPAPANPFGAPSVQTTASTPFGTAPTLQSNPFGATSGVASANPFGNPQPRSTPSTLNPLTNTHSQQPHINGNDNLNNTTHPPLSSYTTKDPTTSRLVTFKNQRVTYRNGAPSIQKRDGTWEKIWFPDGPPAMNRDSEMKDESVYEDEELRGMYMFAREMGVFRGGVMPLVPPRREWCLWDF